MRLVTAVGVGLLSAIATAVLWIVVRFVLPIAVPFLISTRGTQGGIGAASATIGSGSILLAALVGFVGGVAWVLWRR